jgi:hypothetical protein
MDYERIALLLAGCTTPAFRRSLLISPQDTLVRSGFHPGEVAALVASLSKLQAQPSQGSTSREGRPGNVKYAPISGAQYQMIMSPQLEAQKSMPNEWFASYW